MSGYKHIETTIARFIAGRYRRVIEAGAGRNTHTAELLQRAGLHVTCIDLTIPQGILLVPYLVCDVADPDLSLFSGVECIYAIRPVEEMMRPLITLAGRINTDLLVYHLGFEGYDHPRQVSGCTVPLFQYLTRQS